VKPDARLRMTAALFTAGPHVEFAAKELCAKHMRAVNDGDPRADDARCAELAADLRAWLSRAREYLLLLDGGDPIATKGAAPDDCDTAGGLRIAAERRRRTDA
jgi:hypothetical protein